MSDDFEIAERREAVRLVAHERHPGRDLQARGLERGAGLQVGAVGVDDDDTRGGEFVRGDRGEAALGGAGSGSGTS